MPLIARASVILQLVYPLASRIRARWVWSRGRRYRVYMKLDPVKVAWIIREKEKRRLTNRVIADRMGVSPVWVKKLWRRYRMEGRVPELMKPGRRPGREMSKEEQDTVVMELIAIFFVPGDNLSSLRHGVVQASPSPLEVIE